MIDYREPYTQLPAQFQALLYVPRQENVHLTIREADPEYYYWLDQVQPEGGWQPGRGRFPAGGRWRPTSSVATNNQLHCGPQNTPSHCPVTAKRFSSIADCNRDECGLY
jgi:hypothetical protein